MKDTGCKIQDTGERIQDAGCRIQGTGNERIQVVLTFEFIFDI
jgi:hypothetical protein